MFKQNSVFPKTLWSNILPSAFLYKRNGDDYNSIIEGGIGTRNIVLSFLEEIRSDCLVLVQMMKNCICMLFTFAFFKNNTLSSLWAALCTMLWRSELLIYFQVFKYVSITNVS